MIKNEWINESNKANKQIFRFPLEMLSLCKYHKTPIYNSSSIAKTPNYLYKTTSNLFDKYKGFHLFDKYNLPISHIS